MSLPRRQFLGFSTVLFGTSLLEALARPLSKWTRPLALDTAAVPNADRGIPVTYVDVAKEAGLTVPNVWGGVKHKKYIVEAKGSGLAFFDYDHDGWLDIYLTNGVRLNEEASRWAKTPRSHLFKNNRDGTFTDVTEKSGLGQVGWQTGVCVGDYDNDGWDDLFCGYWGHNVLWHNNGDGTFTDVTKKAGCGKSASAGGPAAPGLITTATASSICSCATTSNWTSRKCRRPGKPAIANGRAFR